MNQTQAIATSILTCAVFAPLAACGGDWPQILGPSRNGIAEGERLATEWPKGGPKIVWQRDVGDGVAGVAVAEGRAVLLHRLGGEEVIEAMDARSGERFWKVGFATRFRAEVPPAGNGPRCVPLIHDDSVFAFGAGGDLHCLALADGSERWSRAAFKEFKAPDGYFGAGSSPIVEGDKLLLNVGGGRSGAGLVAFDVKTGKTLWQKTEELASYSSPVAVTVAGVRHVVFVTRYNVVSIDPATGAERFRFPFGARGPTVNAANPLVIDGHVFVTASYGVGAVLAKIGKAESSKVWENDESLSSQYPTAIYKDGNLYGIHGRQDAGVAELRCVELSTGKVRWSQKGYGVATLILADGKLIIMRTDGELELADPTPQAYRPLASARVFRDTVLALPALADGLLYVRDARKLMCLDLRGETTAK